MALKNETIPIPRPPPAKEEGFYSETQLLNFFSGVQIPEQKSEDAEPVKIDIKEMNRNGDIEFVFNQKLIVPNFGEGVDIKKIDPRMIFDLKYIPGEEDDTKVTFDVTFEKWTENTLIMNFKVKPPAQVGQTVEKDKLLLQYKLP